MTLRRTLLPLGIATLLWLPGLHGFFGREPASMIAGLARRQIAFWDERARGDRASLRASNPEWDLMSRTFSVLAFANLALVEPQERQTHLARIDRIIAETIREANARGQNHFLMDYARRGQFRDDRHPQSLFLEGEVALMMAARQLVEPKPELRGELRGRIERITAQLERGPRLSGESYPNEVWTFCNAVALAAIRISDSVLGEDHRALLARWIAGAKKNLVDHESGLLISSFTWSGEAKDGPEGSSIWLVAHLLSIVDTDFARDQYLRAKQALAVEVFGFAYAREWPASWPGRSDVDSGPIVPLVEASAGSSGMALIGAAGFEDRAFLKGLIRSLDLAAFPIEQDGTLRYAAANQLGDAVLLYALVSGPLFDRVRQPEPRS